MAVSTSSLAARRAGSRAAMTPAASATVATIAICPHGTVARSTPTLRRPRTRTMFDDEVRAHTNGSPSDRGAPSVLHIALYRAGRFSGGRDRYTSPRVLATVVLAAAGRSPLPLWRPWFLVHERHSAVGAILRHCAAAAQSVTAPDTPPESDRAESEEETDTKECQIPAVRRPVHDERSKKEDC
jgi:hypothetical protein